MIVTQPQWRWCAVWHRDHAEPFMLILILPRSNYELTLLSRERPCQNAMLDSKILTMKDVPHLSLLMKIISSQLYKYKN